MLFSIWMIWSVALFLTTKCFQWFCHHTYHATSPPLAGYGGCVDEIPSGLGGVDDQRFIYEFAKQLGFMTMGGGGHTHTCFDILCLCSSSLQRCVKAIVLDNGYPGDVSVPVYAELTGIPLEQIGPYCEGANAPLPIDSIKVMGNVRSEYESWVRFSKPITLQSIINNSNGLVCENGRDQSTITTSIQTICHQIYSTGVWLPGSSTNV